jgi:hypothetical protein
LIGSRAADMLAPMGPGRRRLLAPREHRWIAALCAGLLLSASFAASHGHPFAAGRAGALEIDAGCRVCLQSAQLRALAPPQALALPRMPHERSEIDAGPVAVATCRLALGHPSRAPPLV